MRKAMSFAPAWISMRRHRPTQPIRPSFTSVSLPWALVPSKPIVCAVQGPALGGGIGLICNAHVAVAAHGSSFGLTEIRIGMWPFVIYRSVALALGERRALELSLMGRIFNVPEAVQWGLIHEAVPAFELDDRVTAIAMHLAQSSPQADLQRVWSSSRKQGVWIRSPLLRSLSKCGGARSHRPISRKESPRSAKNAARTTSNLPIHKDRIVQLSRGASCITRNDTSLRISELVIQLLRRITTPGI